MPSSSQPDKTYTITQYGSKKGCDCPGYQFNHTCKHIRLTPAERDKQKQMAAKVGRATAQMLADKYPDNEEKINNDPKLKEFMDILNS